MSDSIFAKTIEDEKLGLISIFQKGILKSFRLPDNVFSLNKKDEATGEEYIFARWIVPEDETVYDYMERKGLSIEALEQQYILQLERSSKYDPKKERGAI